MPDASSERQGVMCAGHRKACAGSIVRFEEFDLWEGLSRTCEVLAQPQGAVAA